MRYFVVVAEEGSFTRAAQRLDMQQPPLSQQIQALEKELGFSLFARHPKGVELTAGGEVFLREAKAVLENVSQGAARAARVASGAEGGMTIGFTSSAAAHPLVPQIIRSYRAMRPSVILDFVEGNAAELTDAMESETVAVAFLRQPVSRPTGIRFQKLLDEEMVLVLPAGHAAIRKRAGRGMPSVSLGAVRDEKFVLVRRSGAPGMYANLIDACKRAGFVPAIAAEVERMLTGISLVAAGAGVSAVPASMVGFHAESVVYCRIEESWPELRAPLTLMCRDRESSPTAAQFIEQALRFGQGGKIRNAGRG